MKSSKMLGRFAAAFLMLTGAASVAQGKNSAPARAPDLLFRLPAKTQDALLDRCLESSGDDDMEACSLFFATIRGGSEAAAEKRTDAQIVEAGLFYAKTFRNEAAVATLQKQIARTRCLRGQAEAVSGLKWILTGERSIFAEKDKYSRDFASIGFTPPAGRYKFMVTVANDKTFTAMAVGEGEADGDVWEIGPDGDGKPRNTTNKCASK